MPYNSMVCEIVAQPMRFPEKLIEKIDNYIVNDNLYTTRPDFILDAVRFSYGKLSEKFAEVYEKTHSGEAGYSIYKSRERDLMQMTGMVLLSEYQEYGVEKTQVMLRFPKGLAEDIEKNVLSTRICKNRSDFIRLSIVYKLTYIAELKDLWKSVESYNKDLKEDLSNSVADFILNGFTDKTIFETVKEIAKNSEK